MVYEDPEIIDAQTEDEENEWQDITDTAPNFPEYVGNFTVNVPLTVNTPSDYCELFATSEIIDKMVHETNNCAQNYFNRDQNELKPWILINLEEMKRFLGVLMVMGLVKYPQRILISC